ncbi:helix-turn-helix transcriptional regulator [Psychromonas aquimarina]|uniref:helix-turn-helix transcriptional regulator n=1 Tax=Psychromonas aquimarina TaxID=444919 RepID=UPI000A013C52|nr:AraC family transcriptional regulator [Psychromonas aquimarina]
MLEKNNFKENGGKKSLLENNQGVYVLVPEAALLETLPVHLQERFLKALTLIHDSLAESLTWEEIARQSAISPFHFHRQFSELFNETPGQYLNRVRLQTAVSMLFDAPGKNITEIALEAGYSSSQALAKALKRELNLTGKAIRELTRTGTVAQTSALIAKLAHPAQGMSMEQKLAEKMPCELIWHPRRSLKGQIRNDFDWELACEQLGEQVTKLVTITPAAQMENQWQEIDLIVGEQVRQASEASHILREGYYLCCEVYVTSDVGFEAAWDGLYQYAEKYGYQIDLQGYCIDIVRSVDLTPTGGAAYSLQLPVCER